VSEEEVAFLDAAAKLHRADEYRREAPHQQGMFPPNMDRINAEYEDAMRHFRKTGDAARLSRADGGKAGAS
jgi:hypothetical protein